MVTYCCYCSFQLFSTTAYFKIIYMYGVFLFFVISTGFREDGERNIHVQPAALREFCCFIIYIKAYFIILFILPMLSLCYCTWASSYGKRGLFFHCNAGASHCRGFSCGGVQALGHIGFSSCSSQSLSVDVVHGLNCSKTRGIFWDQRPNVPCIASWILDHQTTWEAL